MKSMSRSFGFMAVFGLLLLVAGVMQAMAQQQRPQRQPPVVTDGVVTAISGNSITVKSADGSTKTIELGEVTRANRNVKMSTSDLKAGMNVMVTPQNSGGKRVLNLNIVPDRSNNQGARRERPQGQRPEGRQGGERAQGQRGQRGQRGGRGGGTMAKVVSTAPLKLESGQGNAREIPANAEVNVFKSENVEVGDVKSGAKVSVREMETPRGKIVMITVNQ